ncbi:Uncharacterised protein [Serratia ficaria]|nr:Uncharacterised protein [Serratia ficaria]
MTNDHLISRMKLAAPGFSMFLLLVGSTFYPIFISENVAPLWGEHGSAAASTVFKIQPHLNAGTV